MATTTFRFVAIFVLVAGLLLGCEKEPPPKKPTAAAQSKGQETDQAAKPGSEGAPAAKAPAGNAQKILVVHSYHPEYLWTASIQEGIASVLDEAKIPYEVYYMDTKRKTDVQWKTTSGQKALDKVADLKPALVITSDDDAQQYFGTKLVGKETKVVFCGVNADPSKYGYPAPNVTGIIERPHFKDTIAYLQKTKQVKKIGMLSCNDNTSTGAFSFMKQDYVDVEVVDWKLVDTFDQWKAAIAEYDKTVDAVGIYMYHTLKSPGSPESLPPLDIMKWTRDNLSVPSMAYFEFGVKDGLLLGIVESGFEHGEKAAKYAKELLAGTSITMLPVVKANVGIKMWNTDTAKKLGLTDLDEEGLVKATWTE